MNARNQPDDVSGFYSPAEERWHTLSHLLGFLLALGAVPVLIALAATRGQSRAVTAFSLYGTTLALTYLASTAYHYARPGRLKHALRRLDHISIYFLIAGTYTPYLLVGLRGTWGWTLFVVLWLLAGAGTIFKLAFGHRFDTLSTVTYVLMGWAGLAVFVPLARALPLPSLVLVLAGGASYTIGALFYSSKRLRRAHLIWHLWCLAGSILQFIGVAYLL